SEPHELNVADSVGSAICRPSGFTMSTDSSAVSDLIQQVHARRLQTDPADLLLFECTNPAQPKRPGVPTGKALFRAAPAPTSLAPAPKKRVVAKRVVRRGPPPAVTAPAKMAKPEVVPAKPEPPRVAPKPRQQSPDRENPL